MLWTRSLGEGYSSIVVDGDLLITMYRAQDEEVIVGLDAGHQERYVDRRRAADSGNAMFRSGEISEHLFEPVHVEADRRHPICIQTFFDVLPLVPSDLRDTKRDGTRPRRSARF